MDAQQMYRVSIVKAAREYMLISHGPMLLTLINHVELRWLMRLKRVCLVKGVMFVLFRYIVMWKTTEVYFLLLI